MEFSRGFSLPLKFAERKQPLKYQTAGISDVPTMSSSWGNDHCSNVLFLVLLLLLLRATADEKGSIGAIGILHVEAKDRFEAV